MKRLVAVIVILGGLAIGPSARAQYVTYYYAPPPVYSAPVYSAPAYSAPVVSYYSPAPTYAAPAYSAPVVTYYSPAPAYAAQAYYAPAPVVTYRPLVTRVYSPVTVYSAPAPVYAAPVPVYGRPVVTYYSPYGGPEVRVPGQPILNTLRAIIP